VTRDKVIRREFRLNEGDAFNSVKVKRSQDRIQSSASSRTSWRSSRPRARRRTGSCSASTSRKRRPASSSCRPAIRASSASCSTCRSSSAISWARADAARLDQLFALFEVGRAGLHRALSVRPQHRARLRPVPARLFSFNFINNNRNTTYKQTSTGGQIRAGMPLTEYISSARATASTFDDVTLEAAFFTDPDGAGPLPAFCDPLKAAAICATRSASGRPRRSAIRCSTTRPTTASADARPALHPQPGFRRPRRRRQISAHPGDAAKYWRWRRLHLLAHGRGRLYPQLRERSERGPGPVRLTDRFFLGEPQIRGFDIRGVGPRVQRVPFVTDEDGNLVPATDRKQIVDDSLGGRAYYVGRAELEIPVSSSFRELGLRPSIFVDVGALFGLTNPVTQSVLPGDPRTINRCARRRRQLDAAPDNLVCTAGSTLIAGNRALRRKLSRRQRQAAPVDRLRSQLELALRPVQDRYSQGALKGRRG
jgi:outer membrane protein insertion porin family